MCGHHLTSSSCHANDNLALDCFPSPKLLGYLSSGATKRLLVQFGEFAKHSNFPPGEHRIDFDQCGSDPAR